jgi:hypothetical protein
MLPRPVPFKLPSLHRIGAVHCCAAAFTHGRICCLPLKQVFLHIVQLEMRFVFDGLAADVQAYRSRSLQLLRVRVLCAMTLL